MAMEVPNIREAIIAVMKDNPDMSKYKLARELNLSTATHINNYLSGNTKKTRIEVYRILLKKFNILVESYKNDPEYKRSLEGEAPKEIKV